HATGRTDGTPALVAAWSPGRRLDNRIDPLTHKPHGHTASSLIAGTPIERPIAKKDNSALSRRRARRRGCGHVCTAAGCVSSGGKSYSIQPIDLILCLP